MSAEIARMEQEMAHDQSRAMMAKYGALVSEFEHAGGYDVNYELERVTNGLSIDADMRAQLFYSLSGGEQTRVNLARVILEKSDILGEVNIKVLEPDMAAGTITVYWHDLTPAKQAEILATFGDNCNYDVFPIVEIPVSEEFSE